MDFEVLALALLGGDVAGDGVDDVSEEPSSDVDFEAAALAILGGDVAGDGGGDDPEAAALAVLATAWRAAAQIYVDV